jgi:hypothetical protein
MTQDNTPACAPIAPIAPIIDYRRISCGCCTGKPGPDGSRVDRCTCHFHQDTRRGVFPRECSVHGACVQA